MLLGDGRQVEDVAGGGFAGGAGGEVSAEAHARGDWSVTLDLEDGQTALETLLTRKVGAAGARLHAGRSRNDQVLAALRPPVNDDKAKEILFGKAQLIRR